MILRVLIIAALIITLMLYVMIVGGKEKDDT